MSVADKPRCDIAKIGGPEIFESYEAMAKMIFEVLGNNKGRVRRLPMWMFTLVVKLTKVFSQRLFGILSYFHLNMHFDEIVNKQYGSRRLEDHFREVMAAKR